MEPEKNSSLEPEKKELTIKMYDVHSSKLQKAGWYYCQQSFQGVFIAEFANQVRYMYFPVSQQVFSDFFKASSKGKYFTDNIEKAPGVKYQKLGQPKLDL
jgi:hypothetical protein